MLSQSLTIVIALLHNDCNIQHLQTRLCRQMKGAGYSMTSYLGHTKGEFFSQFASHAYFLVGSNDFRVSQIWSTILFNSSKTKLPPRMPMDNHSRIFFLLFFRVFWCTILLASLFLDWVHLHLRQL